jgi:hypothetical protein
MIKNGSKWNGRTKKIGRVKKCRGDDRALYWFGIL